MTLQEILSIVSYVLFSAGGLLVLIAVLVFFTKNVPDVHADLTGKKRQKSVEKLEKERPGRKRRARSLRAEGASGKLGEGLWEDAVQKAAALEKKATSQTRFSNLEDSDDSPTTPLRDDDSATLPLRDDMPLTDELADDDSPTILLNDDNGSSLDSTVVSEQIDDSAFADKPAHYDCITANSTVDSFTSSVLQQASGDSCQFEIVRRIVIIESDDFVEIGERNAAV